MFSSHVLVHEMYVVPVLEQCQRKYWIEKMDTSCYLTKFIHNTANRQTAIPWLIVLYKISTGYALRKESEHALYCHPFEVLLGICCTSHIPVFAYSHSMQFLQYRYVARVVFTVSGYRWTKTFPLNETARKPITCGPPNDRTKPQAHNLENAKGIAARFKSNCSRVTRQSFQYYLGTQGRSSIDRCVRHWNRCNSKQES